MNALSSRALFLGWPLLGLLTLGGSSLAFPQESPLKPAPVKLTPRPTDVIAQVGRIAITRADLQGEYERLIPWNYYHGKVPEERKLELRLQARGTLLEKALVHQDAQERQIVVSDEDIRERLSATLAEAGAEYANVDDERFEELFAEFRPNVLRRILIERNEQRFEKSVPAVTEQDLTEHYAKLKDELYAPASSSFQMVQFDVDPSQRTALMPLARLRAQEFREQLIAGESFEALIAKHKAHTSSSGDGAIDFVTERQFPVSEVGPPAFLLADGEISAPLDSIYGVHIVQRLATRPRRLLSFEEARPQLLVSMEHIKRSVARKTWLDAARAKYPVKILIEIGE